MVTRWAQSWRQYFSRPRWRVAALLAVAVFVAGGWFGWRQISAWQSYSAALKAYESRDFEDARRHASDCLQIWPNSASTQLLAARAARHVNQLDEAADYLQAYENLGGNAEEVVLEEDLIRAQRGELAAVEKKLVACIGQDHPDSREILDVVTGEMIKEHRLPEALGYVDMWHKRWPKDREASIRRGWLHEQLRDPEGAIDDYTQALADAPERDQYNQDPVRLRLGQLLIEKKRARQAVRHFEDIYERQPRNEDVILGLARCYRQLNRQKEAAALLDELLAKNPRNGQALGERGGLALDRGEIKVAETKLRAAAKLCPYDRAILHNLFKCLEVAGKETEAEKYSERLDRLRADERRMGQLLAEILKTPRDPDLLYEYGTIFLRNGMDDEGLLWLSKALRYSPRHLATHKALVDYYKSHGQPERANPHFRALNPEGSEAPQ